MASGILQNPGDVVTGKSLGYHEPASTPNDTVVLSMTGTFTNAVVAVEAVAQGQPIVQTPILAGYSVNQAAPASTAEWGAISVSPSAVPGALVASPLGPLSSTGLPGSGFAFLAPAGPFVQMRLRLISIGSGSIQAGVEKYLSRGA
jgi:hypothetical protein